MPLPWYRTIILITRDFMLLNFGLSNHGWEDDCHMYIIRYSDWIIYQCHFLIRYRFKYHARRLFGQLSFQVGLWTWTLLFSNIKHIYILLFWQKYISNSFQLPSLFSIPTMPMLAFNAHFVKNCSEDNQTDWFITFLTFKFCAERKMLP